MTILIAYAVLAERLQERLRDTAFLNHDQRLEVDPEAPFQPEGDETSIVRAAALVHVRTSVVRQILGRPLEQRRYVVERECRLELAIAGPSRDVRLAIDSETLTALATFADSDPLLGGAVERITLGEQTEDELPPNGTATFVTFILRVRSGDPLGRTP